MYQIGDIVIYGNGGVYKVEAIGVPNMKHIDKNKLYYTLNQIYNSETIYTPVDTNVFMRHVITYEEAQELIQQIPNIQTEIYHNSNMRILSEHYQTSMESHDCSDLIKLIKTVYTKGIIVSEEGKDLGQIDKTFLKKAEDLLYSELAIALNIPKESVKGHIEESVKQSMNS